MQHISAIETERQGDTHSSVTHTTHSTNNAYHIQIKKDVVLLLHVVAFSPSVSTWCDAIEKWFFATVRVMVRFTLV